MKVGNSTFAHPTLTTLTTESIPYSKVAVPTFVSTQARGNETRGIFLITHITSLPILQRLPNLSVEEIERMLHLTPLEQTVAVRQLMARSLQQGLDQGLTKGVKQGVKQGLAKGVKQGLAKGVKQGVKQGLEQGELIGKIQLAQRVLKRQVTPKPQLFRRSLSDLKQLLKELESQLRLSVW
jgi:predicted transposase YdaD